MHLTPREAQLLRTTPIEHLVASTIRLLDRLKRYSDPAISEEATQAWQSWKANKTLLVKVWNNSQNKEC